MATTGSRVLFSYIPTGKTKPVSPDANTIYFLEAAQEIHVGDKVIATNVSASIPTITVTGSGDYVSNAVYDSQTNTLTLTKSTLPVYTITRQQTAETGYSATYQLFKDNVAVGDKINIPKDMVVESGEVKTVTEANVPYQGAVVGDKYIDLTIANASSSHIYIPVKDLVDVYTGGTHITVDANNAINHDAQGANAATALGTDDSTHLHVSGQVQYDSLGHVISVADKDIYTSVANIADTQAASAISGLNVASVGGSGKYIAAISETAGEISATTGDIDTTATASSSNLVTSGAAYAAANGAIATWTVVA